MPTPTPLSTCPCGRQHTADSAICPACEAVEIGIRGRVVELWDGDDQAFFDWRYAGAIDGEPVLVLVNGRQDLWAYECARVDAASVAKEAA